jgi:CDP-4-dehydro-6-deoxyglucose reductase/ferredoxin-NAD(P)+ reductase (naphthalene dioxygenase ferredoxin-specific)
MSPSSSRSATACGSRDRSERPYLREGHRGPIIAVAGGSGMAPIKSIVERALAAQLPQHIISISESARDATSTCTTTSPALAQRHSDLHFTPVLSEVAGTACLRARPGSRRRSHADFDELDGCKAYLARPPVMVRGGDQLFEQRGMRRIDSPRPDAFYNCGRNGAAAENGSGTMKAV